MKTTEDINVFPPTGHCMGEFIAFFPARTSKGALCSLLYFKGTLGDICMAFSYFLPAEETPQCEL